MGKQRRSGHSVWPFLVSVLLSLLFVEGAVRVYFATQVGPRILAYGTRFHRNVASAMARSYTQTVQAHGKIVGDYTMFSPDRTTGYSKYFPNEVKTTMGPEKKVTHSVQINRHGFRGPDYEIEKEPGTIRILTLGASSTFGYRNGDHQTYPAQLQSILEASTDGQRYEVINFAIPHATTDNIVAMLLAEGLALSPDIVTLYSGANDSAIANPPEVGTLGRWVQRVQTWSLAVEFLATLSGAGTVADERMWSPEIAELRSAIFTENLGRLQAICAEHGIRFLVATQQVRGALFSSEERRGMTYAEEVAHIRDALREGRIGPAAAEQKVASSALDQLAKVLDPTRIILVHDRVMADLVRWAAENEAELVDTRAALDQRRDLLVSWVHLHPEANRIIAETLAAQILRATGGVW